MHETMKHVSETRWLNPDERAAWLALLAVTTRLPAELDSGLQRIAGITLFDYHVLAMLSEAEGDTLPMSRLAQRANSSLSRLSHVVKKLGERGWVLRRPSEEDARVTVVELTPAGRELLERIAPAHVAGVRRSVFDALDPGDVADLGRIGRKIVASTEPEHWIFSDEAGGPAPV